MRKSKAETAETRKRIVEVAVQAFKSNGIHATGVSEIMAAAGLTHGGFYRHFASKEELVAEACVASLDDLVDAAEVAAEGGQESFLKHIEAFLSEEFRDDRLGGCPLVAMGSELARADIETRRAASNGFRGMIDAMAKRSAFKDAPSARADAMFALSSMIGAVTMSRIVDDPALSLQILEVTRQRVANRAAKAQRKRLKASDV